MEVAASGIRRIGRNHGLNPVDWPAGCNTHPPHRHFTTTGRTESPTRDHVPIVALSTQIDDILIFSLWPSGPDLTTFLPRVVTTRAHLPGPGAERCSDDPRWSPEAAQRRPRSPHRRLVLAMHPLIPRRVGAARLHPVPGRTKRQECDTTAHLLEQDAIQLITAQSR